MHQILAKFDNLESDVKELKHLVTGHGESIKELTTVVTGHGESIKELTSVAKGHDKSIKEVTILVKGHDKSIKELTTVVNEGLKPKLDESHMWIRTLIENKDFQKAELDKLQHKVAVVEGVLHGFADSLEPVKKAQ